MDYAAAVSVRISQIPPELDADVTHKIRQRYKQASLRLQRVVIFEICASGHPINLTVLIPRIGVLR